MRIVVTGGAGFLGWHLRLRLRALSPDADVLAITRASRSDDLAAAVAAADLVVHCAGVNRGSESEVEAGNVALASSLVEALRRSGSGARLVYANSIQSGQDSPYGRGKSAAARTLDQWGAASGVAVSDVHLPNVYGEHGRPGYNSFVATFADRIARGEPVVVDVDRPVGLLHAQDAAQALIDAGRGAGGQSRPEPARRVSVTQVRDLLSDMHRVYAADGSIPDLRDRFDVTMFNTLRAAMFPSRYPFLPVQHTDQRGTLVESVRVHGGQGQSFFSSTVPGQRRGDHFHLDKIERFQVVRGRGLIRLRRVLADDYVEFVVDGAQAPVVDMPTGWSHSIENVGDDELLTAFWSHELHDPERPDTYRDVVVDPATQRSTA
ncbi:NAD-dependent epimerase/dehydratase family protein [Angustibacter sp. McL0619]|uniref:polysaccharide biosynthesis C-terminal domain-containing protein n=1 Tax=Angustibacter sp. McL0619 TaxID=3415676 RepID=UPI003CF8C865